MKRERGGREGEDEEALQLEDAMRSEVDLYSHMRNSSNENRPQYTSHLMLNEANVRFIPCNFS